MCGNVTSFCSLSLNKTVQKRLIKIHLCPEFIHVLMENNQSHKSSANSMLYNVEIQSFSHIVYHITWASKQNLSILTVNSLGTAQTLILS